MPVKIWLNTWQCCCYLASHVFSEATGNNDHIFCHWWHHLDCKIYQPPECHLHTLGNWSWQIMHSWRAHIFWLKKFCDGKESFRGLCSTKHCTLIDQVEYLCENCCTFASIDCVTVERSCLKLKTQVSTTISIVVLSPHGCEYLASKHKVLDK